MELSVDNQTPCVLQVYLKPREPFVYSTHSAKLVYNGERNISTRAVFINININLDLVSSKKFILDF